MKYSTKVGSSFNKSRHGCCVMVPPTDEDPDAELQRAARNGDLARLRALLANPFISPNLTDEYDWTSLHFAADNGQADCLEVLLAWGALGHGSPPRSFEPRDFVDLGNDNDATALHLASAGGHAACVRALIAAGSDVNRENTYGNTPFALALLRGHRHVLKILLRAGADMNRVVSADAWALVDEIRAAGGWANYVTRRREFLVRAFAIATRGKFSKYINAEIASFMELPGGG